MATAADRYTDKTFSQLEFRLSKMYKEAQKDLRKKLEDFTRHHKAKDAEMQRKLKAGEITQAQYQQWITGQVFVGNQWKQKIEQVNNSIKGVMQNASHLTHGKSMDVFAENANYTAYQLEKDLGANVNFGLYDTSTVSRLVGKDPEILPKRVVNGKKLEAWETKKISNAISQGIIQGEGIDQIANRIARDTCIAADHSSVMYARTAITAAQNSGRIERLHEAEEMGIRVQKRWMATLDDRTRDSHAELDGETVGVDEKFSNGLMYPGDPSTNDFAEICNCRCTMVYVYPEFQQSFERTAYYEEGDPEYDPRHRNYKMVQDMTYGKWVEHKRDRVRARYGSDEKIFTQKSAYTKSEKEAIHEYTTSSYSGVNSALREGTVEDYESIKRIVNGIDSAMKKTVVSEGTVASRGASMADLRGMFEGKRRSWFEDPDNLKSLEGQTALFKSYISATKGESVAEPYKRELQWHFTTKGGVHGIDVEQFASSSIKLEREILFDRNSLIEIEKVKFNVDSDGDINGVVEIWTKIREDTDLKRKRRR